MDNNNSTIPKIRHKITIYDSTEEDKIFSSDEEVPKKKIIRKKKIIERKKIKKSI